MASREVSNITGIMRVDYDFNSRESDELSIQENQVVYLLGDEDQGWSKVQQHFDDRYVVPRPKPKIGLVPSSYLSPHPVISSATALYDFYADINGEVSFKTGESMVVYFREGEWAFVSIGAIGKTARGGARVGFVPSNYVKESPLEFEQSRGWDPAGRLQPHLAGNALKSSVPVARSSPRPSGPTSKPDPSKVRVWHDRSGQFRVEAQLLGPGNSNGTIRLHKVNGVAIDVPREKLSEDDLTYIMRHMKDKHAPSPTTLTALKPPSIPIESQRAPKPPRIVSRPSKQEGGNSAAPATSRTIEQRTLSLEPMKYKQNGGNFTPPETEQPFFTLDRGGGEPVQRAGKSTQPLMPWESGLNPDEQTNQQAQPTALDDTGPQVDTARTEAYLEILRRFQGLSWPNSSASKNYDKLDLSAAINYEPWPTARGHFADVHKGKLHNKLVAVKILRLPSYNPYNKEIYEKTFLRFFREMTFWAELEHINVVQLVGFTASKGVIGLVSFWHVDGNLVDHLAANPNASAPDLMLDVSEGTRYLHEIAHLVHGDLKGMNILINEHGIACLADFGISQQMDDVNRKTGFTTSGSVGGTTYWMAPEVMRGDRPSYTSDVYSCAGVFLEICTKKWPFHYLSGFAVAEQKLSGGLPQRSQYPELNGKDGWWDLFSLCWDAQATKRPTIATVVHRLYEECGLRPRVISSIAKRPLKDLGDRWL